MDVLRLPQGQSGYIFWPQHEKRITAISQQLIQHIKINKGPTVPELVHTCVTVHPFYWCINISILLEQKMSQVSSDPEHVLFTDENPNRYVCPTFTFAVILENKEHFFGNILVNDSDKEQFFCDVLLAGTQKDWNQI